MAQTATQFNEHDEHIAYGSNQQFVTFCLGTEVFGFPMTSVLEIIRMPDTIDVPLASGVLTGLANLRGQVLSIIDLASLLQLKASHRADSTRVIVLDVGFPVGLIVDKVLRVIDVEGEKIQNSESIKSTVNVEYLAGVIKDKNASAMVQWLDIEQLIKQEFNPSEQSVAYDRVSHSEITNNTPEPMDEESSQQMVTFIIAQQEYAFELKDVDEIVRVPAMINQIPGADCYVQGMFELRNRALPLMSLRALFGFDEQVLGEKNRILVVKMNQAGGHTFSIGLVVDEMREVLTVESNMAEPLPTLIKHEREDEIASICCLEQGKRLISLLNINKLFHQPLIQSVIDMQSNEETRQMSEQDRSHTMNQEEEDIVQLVVFNLGEQEFGVNIDHVQEITRVPAKLDKVPKSPDFIEGMVNLRGMVLPVLDMRARFEMEKIPSGDRQRIIVLQLDGKRTGFIVDSVSEVLRLSKEKIEKAPELSGEQIRLTEQVVNLKEHDRLIQIIEAHELLTEQEKSEVVNEA